MKRRYEFNRILISYRVRKNIKKLGGLGVKFEYIPKVHAHKIFGYINFSDRFYRFVDEFNIVGVKLSQPTTISASYFLRILQESSSAEARE